MVRKFIVFLLLLTTCLVPAIAQNRDGDIKYRLAQSYERSGDIEAAVKLYNELYVKDSSNVLIFDALRRGYLQLKRYDDAILLLQQMLKRSPNDIILLSQLGSVYIHKADEQRALATWEKAIAVDPRHEATYRLVVNAVIESRMLDKSIELYQRGRRECGDPNLFALDIAYLYSVMLKYGDATREYLNVIRQSPGQLMYVQSRIASFTGRGDGLTASTAVVEQAVLSEPNVLPFYQLVAWLYMEGKHFGRAFETYKTIDAKMNSSGQEIYIFAERALNEKAYEAAQHAFLEVINHHPSFDKLEQARFGYARSLEELSIERDTIRQPSDSTSPKRLSRPETEAGPVYSEAITAYRRVIDDYPNTELAARSLLHIGMLQLERFFDVDAARASFETLLSKSAAYPAILSEATLRLGDLYLIKGDLALAEAQYLALTQHQIIIGEHREKAALHLAELDYFRGKFQDALAKLRQLSRNTSSDIANDAMKLQLFIRENLQSGEAALKAYAEGELLQRQRKSSEALTVFQSITKTYATSTLVDECLMNEGDIFSLLQRHQDAIDAYRRLVNNFPQSLIIDVALMNIGTSYQKDLHDTTNANITYEQLLEKFPKSMYASEARKRVRALRGDTF